MAATTCPNLSSITLIRKEMAFIYRKARNKKIPTDEASRLVNMLKAMHQAVQSERELMFKERQLEAGAGGTHVEIHQHTTSLSVSAGILEEIAAAAEARHAALAGEDRPVLSPPVSPESP